MRGHQCTQVLTLHPPHPHLDSCVPNASPAPPPSTLNPTLTPILTLSPSPCHPLDGTQVARDGSSDSDSDESSMRNLWLCMLEPGSGCLTEYCIKLAILVLFVTPNLISSKARAPRLRPRPRPHPKLISRRYEHAALSLSHSPSHPPWHPHPGTPPRHPHPAPHPGTLTRHPHPHLNRSSATSSPGC